MKDHLDLSSIFKNLGWIKKIQFGHSIHIVDNTKEYFSAPFNSLMASCGMTYRSTCLHKDDITDRIHGLIIENTCILMLSAIMYL
jgi:hypothetical protein